MSQRDELAGQTARAFEFLQKLYEEVAYLIGELESNLLQQQERFVICKPTGYGVSARSSTGIQHQHVELWLLRKFAVAFTPEDKTEAARGITETAVDQDLCAIYFRFVLNGDDLCRPVVKAGVLYNIEPKHADWWKLEKLLGHIEYNEERIFHQGCDIHYEDSYVRFSADLRQIALFKLNDREAVQDALVEPCLQLYRRRAKG